MKDNESMVSSTETEQVESTTEKTVEATQNKEKTFSRNEVNKMINAEREKLKTELLQEFETKKSEAEKLAKMDAEQKLKYELDLEKERNKTLESRLNSMTLKTQANAIANEKGLPLGYIEDFDYSKETAETIKEKIDKLVKLRSNDLDGYLKDKLKQNPPKAVESNKEEKDPYIQGFKNYMNRNKK